LQADFSTFVDMLMRWVAAGTALKRLARDITAHTTGQLERLDLVKKYWLDGSLPVAGNLLWDR
jgi:hypothetical protein